MSGEGGGRTGEGCTVRFNTSWVMVTLGPLWTDRQTDTHVKYYLPTTSLAGGKNSFWCKKMWSIVLDRSMNTSDICKCIY